MSTDPEKPQDPPTKRSPAVWTQEEVDALAEFMVESLKVGIAENEEKLRLARIARKLEMDEEVSNDET